MVRSAEAELTMLVVHAKHQHGGFYIALVPDSLDAGEVDAGLKELEIDAAQVFQLSNWKTSAQGLAVAFLPFPGLNCVGGKPRCRNAAAGSGFTGRASTVPARCVRIPER